jgi:hypothetical protein
MKLYSRIQLIFAWYIKSHGTDLRCRSCILWMVQHSILCSQVTVSASELQITGIKISKHTEFWVTLYLLFNFSIKFLWCDTEFSVCTWSVRQMAVTVWHWGKTCGNIKAAGLWNFTGMWFFKYCKEFWQSSIYLNISHNLLGENINT